MSRVLVDLLFYTGRKGGMESYVREIYRRIDPAAHDLEFIGLASTQLASTGAPWFPGRLVDSGVDGEDRRAWAAGELFAVDRHARRLGADVVHAPANLGPAAPKVPVVLTVHDLLAFRFPEYVPGPYAVVLRAMIRRAARRAARIVTVSESSKRDIVELLHVPEGRVDVTPLAGGPTAPPPTDLEREADLLLAVGNRMPHKNFTRLLEAISRIPVDRRPRLVITGSHAEDPLLAEVRRLGIDDHVSLEGWVDSERLEELYASATVFVFPTLFEGFGLPPLEAMSRGCPVICSDLEVLRETAGAAAMYVDAESSDAIADAISTLLADPERRAAMSAAGRERARSFSWQRTADATVSAIQRGLIPR
ncbi:glycosyltransferase family 4 protein [Agromyces sp. NPDC058136]|uniref:glycosyltransferase family 4 protein n=1 Tax=Agromyces sp. NPDC058136 TaxID=3346354 RepID=UPI0036DC71F5